MLPIFPFGNLGEMFPYTNIHNMNDDWLITIVKKLSDQFPTFETDLAKKLNKPEQEGADGDILVNRGEGITEWLSFETYSTPTIIQAVYDWLNEHPEATTTVQDNSISLAKLTESLRNIIKNLNSRPAKMGVAETLTYNKSRIMDTLASGDYSLQGCEYNSNRDRYVFCFSTETLTPIIIETDNEFNYIRHKTVPSGGHMNDITYNPNTDKYYIATSDSTIQVVCVDGTSLDTLSAIALPAVAGVVTRISYDSISDTYFIYNSEGNINTNVYQLTNDFTQKTLMMTNVWNRCVQNMFTDSYTIYGQGSTMFNGRFVLLFWFGFEHNLGISRMVFLNSDNTNIDFFFDFENLHIFDESETIMRVGNNLYIPSYYSNKINISRVATNGVTAEELNTLFRTPLAKYTYSSENPTMLEDFALYPDENSIYKCWMTFQTNPAGISGEQGVFTGLTYGNNNGMQMLIEPSHFYYRKKINNEFYGWHDILLNPRETTTNILTEALAPFTAGVQYLRYTGTDYSWLPFNDSNFRYAEFKIEYCYSSRIVTAIDVTNNLRIRNEYVNNVWTGWFVEGIATHTSNILDIARTVKKGRYSIRYTGQDASWLPNQDTGFIYGIFEITNFTDSIIKVVAYNYNGTKTAVNMYINNQWNGWKMYTGV